MEQYDRILVLEKGKIVAQCMLGELMDGNGLYRRLQVTHTSTAPLAPALACRVNERFRPTL